jgi:hypothetical protein
MIFGPVMDSAIKSVPFPNPALQLEASPEAALVLPRSHACRKSRSMIGSWHGLLEFNYCLDGTSE